MNSLLYLLTTASTGVATEDPASSSGGGAGSIIYMVFTVALMIGVFYFLLIRPERKRSKKSKEMLNNLQVADEVVTTGGIIGRVISIKEDTVLIETGGDKTRIRVLRSCIAENRTVHDTVS
jgi:preprotein translocase subunit YajC